MGCNCLKNRMRTEDWLWIPPGGSNDGEGTVRYESKIQADAKVLRAGGHWIRVPVLVRR